MIKLCIFDMDGLLLDSERYMWSVNEQRASKELGKEIPESIIRSIIGGSNEKSRKTIMEYFNYDFPIDEFYNLVFKYNDEMVNENKVPLKRGALEILDYLKKQNISISLGTSSNIDYVSKVLKSLKIYDYFDYIVTKDDVKNGKPDPDIYLCAFNKYNYKNDETIVLEDAHNGILAATRANLKTILVKDMSILSKEDLDTAIFVANDLFEAMDFIKSQNS